MNIEKLMTKIGRVEWHEHFLKITVHIYLIIRGEINSFMTMKQKHQAVLIQPDTDKFLRTDIISINATHSF